MRVRSFELPDADLRQLHDYLMDVGGFQFRAGGQGFFVLVGERFFADPGVDQTHLIIAQSEAGMITVDVIASGAGAGTSEEVSRPELWFLQWSTELLRGYGERHALELVDI